MPVVPHRANLFQDRQELHQFLLDCLQTFGETDSEAWRSAIHSKIVSVSLEIPSIDPLGVLQKLAQPDALHFYFEKRDTVEAIAAIGAAIQFTVDGEQRFAQAQDFIQSCLERVIPFGTTHLPFSGPHFFCSFTFFDETVNGSSYFPAATLFLPQLQITRQGDCCILVINTLINARMNIDDLSETLFNQVKTVSQIQESPRETLRHHPHNFCITPLNQSKTFKKSVLSALKLINDKLFNKIVLAQAIDIFSKTTFNLVESLNNLRLLYPDCYIFSTSNGKGQNFIGASPERLISVQNNQLVTDALAGSAPRGKTAAEDAILANRLLCSEKDLHEHRVVIDFIIQHLFALGLKPHRSPVPCLLQLSNIQHLWTPITASVSKEIHLLEILAQLHPTPAVAGVPREIAQTQIRHYETFDRSLYAAPLGWIDHQGNGEFVVGIRSALIDGNRARLYAGAGIVAGSEPDKELAEIQLKLQALLNALV